MSNIMTQIQEKAQYWKSMDRSDEEKRMEAEKYYKENIMPLLVTMFKESDAQDCEHLILTLGTSYEPVVFSILGLKPKNVLILYTPESKDKLDDVIYFTNLKPSQYEAEEVDSTNILILYEKIKNYYEKHKKPQNIYVDFTGGTKAMSVGCGMAAALIGAKVVYIASNYLNQFRKPEPGTERICFIDNPYEVFGDLKRKESIDLFNKMDYKTAYDLFSELYDTVPGTKEYEALKYLSLAYDQWDSLNISQALESLIKCKSSAEKECIINNNHSLAKHLKILEKQVECLKVLNDVDLKNTNENKGLLFDNIEYIIFMLYQNALRREQQGKYEMASLLLYRILEMMSQSRLWERGIDTEKITEEQYSALGMNPEDLLQKVNYIKRKIGEKQLEALPSEISLLMGYIILGIIRDSLIETENENKLIGKIKEIKGKVISRNNGIFAHGFQFQEKEGYEKFKETVVEYMKKYCETKSISFDEISKELEFIRL
ncbi:TIGR02710 family CRISPR-associated CARF protein [Lutispora thermophila]|uniref:CRISPR-associated protein, TIGR02710 family n=1 Tax=Lutispora thermophila DSM 19022 TaxID=1122184 RepID=A0A1M6GC66_9FIRM|nr:TIGR02710 family CRISPR-associated CARF protein [Lutispora thermophila]SHJ07519.1 CRISPR-associated protein, TIGR02710 family [Lutispora thermophila DSM 19022]